MTHSLVRSLAACAASLVAVAAAPASTGGIAELTGNWVTADPGTRGITQVVVETQGGQLLVHVWGKCHPSDCDWGEQPAQVFTPSVSTPVDTGADKLIVQFDQRGGQTMLLLETSGGTLSYKTFTIFNDTSNRSNYHASGRLMRQ